MKPLLLVSLVVSVSVATSAVLYYAGASSMAPYFSFGVMFGTIGAVVRNYFGW